jgi:hypothetical protein
MKRCSHQGTEVAAYRGGIAKEAMDYLMRFGSHVGDNVLGKKALAEAWLTVDPEFMLSWLAI